ncbi:hypothetical protein ROP_00560 [Rhodococcus opacus B4]|uniref:Uncharacterized protein n=1 Tax=Rhodococcus opacus (strain B4) TaxID=632772 RepID=C1AS54_RHOOB|nr:hypothetical protein ROP_00560 [Rhodococcus opacus B4]
MFAIVARFSVLWIDEVGMASVRDRTHPAARLHFKCAGTGSAGAPVPDPPHRMIAHTHVLLTPLDRAPRTFDQPLTWNAVPPAAVGGTAPRGLDGGGATDSAGENKQEQGDIEVHGTGPSRGAECCCRCGS